MPFASRRALCASMTIGLLAAGAAFAEYPESAIKMVVPFPPGGSADVAARVLAENMSKTLAQPVVVENRDGAGGSVGIAYVASTAPDGYTVGVSGIGASILLPGLGQDTGFDMEDDLEIVGNMGMLGLMLAGHPDFGPQTFGELIAYAKENPGELAYGTSGVGTPGHLTMALIAQMAGLDIIHIPYRGNTPLLNDVLGGHVDVGVMTIPGTSEQIASGALVGYASTASEREPLLPDVQIVGEEAGFEGFGLDLWNLLVVPDGTPDDVKERLSGALTAAMQDPQVIESLRLQSVRPSVMSVDEANAFFDSEKAKWDKVIADSHAEAE